MTSSLNFWLARQALTSHLGDHNDFGDQLHSGTGASFRNRQLSFHNVEQTVWVKTPLLSPPLPPFFSLRFYLFSSSPFVPFPTLPPLPPLPSLKVAA